MDAKAPAVDLPTLYSIQKPKITQKVSYANHPEVDNSTERPSRTIQNTGRRATELEAAEELAAEVSAADTSERMTTTQ